MVAISLGRHSHSLLLTVIHIGDNTLNIKIVATDGGEVFFKIKENDQPQQTEGE